MRGNEKVKDVILCEIYSVQRRPRFVGSVRVAAFRTDNKLLNMFVCLFVLV